jgi:glucan phosphoethanolaminetransferase (alkaline phosphatase superfamily)
MVIYRLLCFTVIIEVVAFCYWYAQKTADTLSAFAHGLFVVIASALLLSTIILTGRLTYRTNRTPSFVLHCLVLLTTTILLLLWALHALIAVGLYSWGNVPNVAMAKSYWAQLPFLLDTVGVSASLAGTLAIFLIAFTWVVCAISLRARIAQPSYATKKGDPAAFRSREQLLVTGLAFSAFVYALYTFFSPSPWIPINEPLRLVFLPQVVELTQNWVTSKDAQRMLASEEDRARDVYQPSEKRPATNVVLITVDALRADRLQIFGHSRATTPNLTRLNARGLLHLVPEARGHCAESLCGLLSLLTGRPAHRIASNSITLSEVLRKHGYSSHAFLSGDHTNFYSIRSSYGVFDSYYDNTMGPKGAHINDDLHVLRELENLPQSDSKPRFIFIHLMSAHGLGAKDTEFQRFQPSKTVYFLRSGQTAPELRSEAENGYDNGVLQADDRIARILNLLEEKNYFRDGFAFITGDHGELLGENGIYGHAKTLDETVLRVPWIWYGKNSPVFKLQQPVLQSDFAPTVLHHLGLPIPTSWTGRALQRNERLLHSFHIQAELAAVIDYSDATRTKYLLNKMRNSEETRRISSGGSEAVAGVSIEAVKVLRRALVGQQLARPHHCITFECPDRR